MKKLFFIFLTLLFFYKTDVYAQFWKKNKDLVEETNERDAFSSKPKKRPNIASDGDPKMLSKKGAYVYSISKKGVRTRTSQRTFSSKKKRHKSLTSRKKKDVGTQRASRRRRLQDREGK